MLKTKRGLPEKGQTFMPISKTDFVRGLQCEKMLWLDAHAPELKIIPPEIQEKLDAGNAFGDVAMGIFGDYTETTTFRDDGRLHYAAMIAKTQELLAANTPVICEGSFSWYGNFCAADILRKEENGYTMYEVKNTFYARDAFLTDLGFQAFILQKCGVKLGGVHLVLRGDEAPADAIKDEFESSAAYIEKDGFRYRIIDVTRAIKPYQKLASERIFELGKIKKKEAEMPHVPIGTHCETPYRCWYFEHCHKKD
jgi:hypothetical protein